MRRIQNYYSRLVPFAAGLLICMMMFTACGGGSSDGSDPTGELVMSLTDGAGDFANYEVDVVDVTLTDEDGNKISVLPTPTRVNFAQYTDISEVLVAVKVPVGKYDAVTVTVDYSDADIWVETVVGDLVKVDVSNIVDENGAVMTQVDVDVDLDPENPLVIAPQIPVHVQVDYDLELSNEAVFDSQSVSVSVDPYVLVEVDVADYKIHRLRGLLGEATPEDGSFTVAIRPFYTPLNDLVGDFGRMTVTTGSETLYEIDNQTYEGPEGLEAMAALSGITPVVVEGSFNPDTFQFEAEAVYVGFSVPWGHQDVAHGVVTAREGNELTLGGTNLTRIDGSVDFNDEVTVLLDESTVIRREFSMEEMAIEDVAAGQMISAFGTLDTDDPENIVLDASEGYVRIHSIPLPGLGRI